MNIIYIHTHDSGILLSPYGYQVPTKRLKQFSEDATLFRQAFCASPTCSPSRASLLTGMYAQSNGMIGLAQRGFQINDYSKHLVNFLKSHQYTTALCGIQHEAGWYLKPDGAERIGYDFNITTSNKGYAEEDLVKWDQANVENACQWLDQYDFTTPLFLSVGFFATHRAFPKELASGIEPNYVMPPRPLADNEQTRLDFAQYMTSAKWFDDSFGELIDKLKELDIYDKSIIIFTTDHGYAVPFHKCNLYDGGIQVALAMRIPGFKMKFVDQLVSQIDIFPTLCDALHLERPDYLQGKSILPLFESNTNKIRDEIFAEINFHTSYEPVRCIRTKRYKYIRYYDQTYLKVNQSNIDASLIKKSYQEHELAEYIKPSEALYDLFYDPDEKNNVVNQERYKSILDDLKSRLKKHLEDINDPILHGPIVRETHWKVNKKECVEASSKNPNDYEVN